MARASPPGLRSIRAPPAYFFTTTGKRLETLIKRPLTSVIAPLRRFAANYPRIRLVPAVVAARYRQRSSGPGDEPARSDLVPSMREMRLHRFDHHPDRRQRRLGSFP